MKRTAFLWAGALMTLAAAALEPDPIGIPSSSYGPPQNKEDQYRYFWSGPVKPFLDAGFNLVANWLGRDSDFNRPGVLIHGDSFRKKREEQLAKRRELGVGYAERFGVPDGSLARLYPTVDRNGGTGRPAPDMTNPKGYAALLQATRLQAENVPDDPTFVLAHVNSEIRDNARVSFTRNLGRMWAEASGGRKIPINVQNRHAPHWSQLKDFPVSRIVPEDDKLLTFYRWYWLHGDRWNDYATDATRIFQDRANPPATMYDPVVRCPPIRGNGGKVTFANQWVYVVPEPYNICFSVSEENALVRGHPGQGVWAMIQAITYRRDAAPGAPPDGTKSDWYARYPECRYITTPPDLMREAMWCLFARRLDGHCHYGFQALLPQPDPVDRKTGKSAVTPFTYVCTETNTYHVIAELFRRVGEPLGPLLRAAPERPSPVAFLESFTTTIFAHKMSGSRGGAIFDAGALAVVAGVQPSVLYEEDLAEGGVPAHVRVLLAPHCDVLSQKTFDVLRAWQLKGGVLVGDRFTPPALMRDYDFPGVARTKRAAEDGPAIRKAAQKLRDIVSHGCDLYSGATSEDVFTWVRTAGGADYLFAINDRRVPGEYVGAWGVLNDKGLPTACEVWLARRAGAVYDLERHQSVPFTVRDGRTLVKVDLKGCDGAVLMATEEPLKPLSVSLVRTGSGVELTVQAAERDILIPVEITGGGLQRPFYAVVCGGQWRHVFAGGTTPFKIRNLADGRVVTCAGEKK